MSFSIDGKTVIVTGAANGIGAALARHFAENGANVMCADTVSYTHLTLPTNREV